jgi:hypothetical protein
MVRVIEQTFELLADSTDPTDRYRLVCALDKLLDRERILRNEPLPGVRRPAPVRPPSRAAMLGFDE